MTCLCLEHYIEQADVLNSEHSIKFEEQGRPRKFAMVLFL